MSMKIDRRYSVLLLIDLQNDFCADGALAVPDGEAVIALANQLQAYFSWIVASKDWHPANHVSFMENQSQQLVDRGIVVAGKAQAVWPAHCVAGTLGAEFHQKLQLPSISHVIYKGVYREHDSYSAFGTPEYPTDLHKYLQERAIQELYIMGLATDYCVLHTVLDAVHHGYRVFVIQDACRGVAPDTTAQAWQGMQAVGARLIQCADIQAR